jgi:hypothetical protein
MSGLTFGLIRVMVRDPGRGLTATFVAILPNEDGSPRKDARHKPPGGLENQEKKQHARAECQQTGFKHEQFLCLPKITHNIA